MQLKEMFNTGKIPMYYMDCFPPALKCECGTHLVSNSTLSVVECPNPACYLKLAARLDNVLTQIGVTGYSRDSLAKYVKGKPSNKLLLSVFDEEPSKPFLEIKKWLKNEPHTLRQVVWAMQLPKYPTNLARVFKGYKSINDWVAAITPTTYQNFISMKLLKRVTDSVESMAEILSDHTEEIIRICLFANILPYASEYDIMITGNISPIKYKGRLYQTKYDFVQLCNQLGQGKVAVNATTSYQEVDCIICDVKGSTTSKANKGNEYGKLITSLEFIDKIKKEVAIYGGNYIA